jgi:AraC family transcriptional regulator
VVSNDLAAYLPEQNRQEVTAVKVVDIGILSSFRSSPRSIVEISPPDIARRRLENWGAIRADNVSVTRRETFEYGLQTRRHLLIA